MEKCIGCELCAGVCPARCIYVRGADNPPDDPVSPGERYGFVYEINYLRCIHCDLCVEACPTEAITETKLFEFSFTNRQDAIYTKDELLVGDDGRPQQLPWEDWREGEDEHTSAWMRATSPSGDADFEGRWRWSGELGYGVRAPEQGQAAESTPEPADGHGPTTTTATAPRRRSLTWRSVIFLVCALIVLGGAFGVVLVAQPRALRAQPGRHAVRRSPCCSSTRTPNFLAAVQVIVYTGAIVVLILFVLMLLGVDRDEDLDDRAARRPAALRGRRRRSARRFGVLVLGGRSIGSADGQSSPARARRRPSAPVDAELHGTDSPTSTIGELLFTDYVFAFEITAALLTIAVVGAVVLAAAPTDLQPIPRTRAARAEPTSRTSTPTTRSRA